MGSEMCIRDRSGAARTRSTSSHARDALDASVVRRHAFENDLAHRSIALSAAEEAKRSASDTARRIAMAAAEPPRGSVQSRACACNSSRAACAAGAGAVARAGAGAAVAVPRLDTAAARAFASRSFRNAPTMQPADEGPSVAELAKRRAEEAAREMARSAELRAPRGAWMSSNGGAAASAASELPVQRPGDAVRTEAEAAKHRASAFAKELGDRVERETARQRRAGGDRDSSTTSSAESGAPVAAQHAPQASGPSSNEADDAPAGAEAKRSARSLGPKRDAAWLLTLLRPEHRSAGASRSHFSRNTSRVYPRATRPTAEL